MSGSVFAIVLLAAALHALWNAMVRGGVDKDAAMAAVVLGQGGFGAPAPVTALRETSIVFALLIGVGVLKERLDPAKLVSTGLTVFGAALLRLAAK